MDEGEANTCIEIGADTSRSWRFKEYLSRPLTPPLRRILFEYLVELVERTHWPRFFHGLYSRQRFIPTSAVFNTHSASFIFLQKERSVLTLLTFVFVGIKQTYLCPFSCHDTHRGLTMFNSPIVVSSVAMTGLVTEYQGPSPPDFRKPNFHP